MVYIDTSLLAAYYCPEPLSHKAQAALLVAGECVISSLVELEFHSAIASKVRARELTRHSAGRILSMFQAHVTEGRYRFVEIGAAEYGLAKQWIGAFAVPLRTLDALHLAAASANELAILTADRAMAQAASHFAIQHELIA